MTVPAREPLLGRVWTRAVWPVLAGLVCAIGLVGAATIGTWAGWLSAVLTMSLFAGVMSWSLAPGSVSRALRVAVAAPLGVTVVVGWLVVSPQFGLLVTGVVALSSPRVLDAVRGLRRRARDRRTTQRADQTRATQRVLLDREMVDRRFAEIAQQLHDIDETLES